MNQEDYFDDLLMRTLDGKTDESEFQTFAEIIRMDPELRRRYEDEARVHALLSRLGATPAVAQESRFRLPIPWRRPLMLAASLALIFAGSFVFTRQNATRQIKIAPQASMTVQENREPAVPVAEKHIEALEEKGTAVHPPAKGEPPAAKPPRIPQNPLLPAAVVAGNVENKQEKAQMNKKQIVKTAVAALAMAVAAPKTVAAATAKPPAAAPLDASSVVTNVWTGKGDGHSWSDNANWSDGSAPVSGEAVSISTASGGVLTNDLAGLSLCALSMDSSAYAGFEFQGNALTVPDGGLAISMKNLFFYCFLPFAGSGTIRVTSDAGRLLAMSAPASSFAGKWVVDNTILQVTNAVSLTSIGSGTPDTPVADAVTLLHGAVVKNFASSLNFPARIGFTLGEGGGGFLCGWSDYGAFSNVVNGPITGPGALLFSQCVFPTILNNPANSYAGGTIIGSNANGAYQASAPTICRLGCDNAIPSNSTVTIDGGYNGQLDMSGYSLTLSSLILRNNGTVVNSSSAQASLNASVTSLGGTVADNIAFTCSQFPFEVADTAIWTNRFLTVASGETITVSNSAGIGGMAVKLAGGTLSFPATAGFTERHYFGNSTTFDDKAIDRIAGGSDMGSVTNRARWKTNESYYYQSQWYVPESGAYSFCKSFDDSARLAIDGGIIVDGTLAWTEQRASASLPAGWHEVRLWYANGSASAGPGNNWTNGLLWANASSVTVGNQQAFDCSNGEFTFVPSCSAPIYVGPGGGTLLVEPDATVTGKAPALILRGGLVETADNTAHDAVTLASTTYIGNRGNAVTLFDAKAALSGNASLAFRNKVWVKRIPECAYTIAPGTAVYLNKDTLSMTSAVSAAGANISMAPFNQSILPDLLAGKLNFTLRCASTYLGLNPVEDNVLSIWTNDFPVAPTVTLSINATGDIRLSGRFSGNGAVIFIGDVNNGNLAGDNSAFAGSWSVLSGNLYATNAYAFGSSSATVTVLGGSLVLGDVSPEPLVFAPSFSMQGGTLIVSARSATVGALTAARSDGLLNLSGGTLCVAAENLSLPNKVLSLPTTATLAVTVAQGETWNPGAISGGGTLIIRGGGSVSSDALTGFTGTLRLENGTLHNANALAVNPSFWLDASAMDSLVFGSGNSVLEWHDVRDGVAATNYPYCYLNGTIPNYGATGCKAAYPPTQYSDTNALLPVLDFGAWNSGKWFYFSRGVPMQTVVFVLGSQNGGGSCWFGHTNATSGIVRGTLNGTSIDASITIDNPIYNSESYANALFANSFTRVDGTQVNPATTGVSGGYQVFSTRISESYTLNGIAKDIRTFASNTANGTLRAGGMRFAEILFYDRALTDDEIAATENYLSTKWIGKALDTGAAKTHDFYTLEGGDTGKVQVDSAYTVQNVKALTGDGTLEKTGPGTFTVDVSSSGATGTVELAEGGYSINGPAAQFASDTLPKGLNPAFWADANVASSYGIDGNGRFYWRDCRWDGVTDYVVATQRWSTAPFILTNDINGSLSVLSFGALSTTHDRGLQWSKNLNAQAVFMLIGSQETGGIILGGTDNLSPFNRYDIASNTTPLYTESTSASIVGGTTRLDTVPVNGITSGFSGGYQVLSVVPTAAVTVGQFAHDRELTATQKRDGGQRLGEVLIFTNALSYAQARQVEGYLMTRWLRPGSWHYADSLAWLTTKGAAASNRFVDVGKRTLSLGTLSGTASLKKNGEGILSVSKFNDFSNTLTLAEGSLSLPNGNAFAPPQDALFWVDASVVSSITLSNGNEVVRWGDCRNNGRYAARDSAFKVTVNSNTYTNPSPTLLENALNGLPVVDFGAWMSGEFLNWNAPIKTIRTVFWVIGSQNGGGILLDYDKSDTTIRDFWRGGGGSDLMDWTKITSPANTIWTAKVSAPYTAVCNAPTRLNGTTVNGATTGLTGGYDLVVVRTTANARASVFNNDRGRWYRDSTGGQRLAEVIIYDRVLTDTEVEQTEKYLSAKWGLSIASASGVSRNSSAMTLLMNSGSTLFLNKGVATSLAGFGGIGTVTNGDVIAASLRQISGPATNSVLALSGSLTVTPNAVWSVALSNAMPALITVAGTTAFEGGGKLVLTGAKALAAQSRLLIKCGTVNGFAERAWKVESDDSGHSYKLIQTNEGILLKVSSNGTVIMLM